MLQRPATGLSFQPRHCSVPACVPATLPRLTCCAAQQPSPPQQQQQQQQGVVLPLTPPAAWPSSGSAASDPQYARQSQSGLELPGDSPPQLVRPRVQSSPQVAAVWQEIRGEVEGLVSSEPEAGGLLHHGVTIHDSLESSLAFVLSNKLASSTLSPAHLLRLINSAMENDPSIAEAVAADLVAAKQRDVACDTYTKALLFFKGFHAVQSYRISHWMWKQGRREVAHEIQGRMAKAFNVDIHPAARIGTGLLLDHATGIVVGQTCVVGDNVSMLHRVVLGGSGFEIGRRHPTIEDGVLLGTGVNVFGSVTVGANSKVGAGSLVVEDVPPNCVAVGVPAKVIKRLDEASTPLGAMDQGTEYILDYEI